MRAFCNIRSDFHMEKTESVPPPLTFLLKIFHFNYVNCNEFHQHERLFMIVVQQVPKR